MDNMILWGPINTAVLQNDVLVFFMFDDLVWEVIVRFVDIGGQWI